MLRECNYLDDYTWIVEKFSSSGGDDRGRRSVRVYERRTSGSGSHTQWPKEPKHLFDIPVCQGVTRHLRRFHTKRDPLWPSSRSIYELRTIRVQLRVKIVNNRRQMARKGNCFLLPPLFSPPLSLFSNPRHLFVSSLSFLESRRRVEPFRAIYTADNTVSNDIHIYIYRVSKVCIIFVLRNCGNKD